MIIFMSFRLYCSGYFKYSHRAALFTICAFFIFSTGCATSSHKPKKSIKKSVVKKVKAVAETSKPVAPAQPARDKGQNAKIKIDGSAVYQVPNFDSPILEYLDSGKEYKVSQKIYPGIGGLGSFYKIRLAPGNFGYITDTDIVTEGLSMQHAEVKEASEEVVENDPSMIQEDILSDKEPEDESNEAKKGSIIATQFLGASYNTFSYSEILRNKTESAATSLLGVKFFGPLEFMGGMPLDINAMFTTTAPSFYSKISTNTPGMMLMGDVLTLIPMHETKSILIYYGLGLMGRYSKWTVTLKPPASGPDLDSQEVGIGLAAQFGATFRFNQLLALSAQTKYYFEKEKYLGYGLTLLFKY